MDYGNATVTDAELTRLAELACLQLPQDASARSLLAGQLGSILGYVAAIQRYEAPGGADEVDPILARADEPTASPIGSPDANGRPAWLVGTPAAEGQLVAVPALFAGRSNGNAGDA